MTPEGSKGGDNRYRAPLSTFDTFDQIAARVSSNDDKLWNEKLGLDVVCLKLTPAGTFQEKEVYGRFHNAFLSMLVSFFTL